MSSSTSQVALLNNHHSSLFADHQEQICSNMAFFTNFTSSTLLSSSALKSSGHDNIISAFLLPADHLSSSSSSSVSTETLLSSSTATVAPLREVTPVNAPGTPHILSLHPNGASPASANNYWAWGELNQGLLSNKLVRDGGAGVNLGDRDHHHQQHHTSNSSSLLGMSAMKMKKIKARRKVRDPRFCFKTLSEVDVLDDGYKWRKYGQKVVKNTQHPRSYYRCTQDNCRVKKRVERLAEDPRMVITTYEGRHMHSPSQDTEDMQAASNSHLSNDFFW